ncbi:MAG: hypothetical protein QF470_02030 [Methylococcales bacterium]|nr:hypothetical protein [Methylococcales bacterium]
MNLSLKFLTLFCLAAICQGCVFTKVLSVPMRMGGAVISIIPVVGNQAHDSIDAIADSVDDIPF